MAASNAPAPARSRALARWHTRRQLAGALYAAPSAVVVAVLFLVPVGLVLWMSLNEWPLIGEPSFNLPANYTAIERNPLFGAAVLFTLKYTVIVTIVLFGAALGLALLVQRHRPGVGLFRTAFFLPGAVGFATASLLFYGLLSRDLGPLSSMLSALGLVDHPVSWVSGSPNLALGSSIGLVVWRFAGFNMLLLLNGLQAIPEDLYEAARVDGAGRWQQFLGITLPLMRPTIALVLIVMITGSLLAFDQFYILTNGGPDNSTTSIVMVIVREAFTRFDLGAAAAVSVVVLAALIVLNMLQLRILRRGDRPGAE
ncbi:MAG TPA: sugar ABC transporter permease [Kofleriaceae bacterium]|nr:sugar ABC transporter permease [Kofleriaceae bacterium]